MRPSLGMRNKRKPRRLLFVCNVGANLDRNLSLNGSGRDDASYTLYMHWCSHKNKAPNVLDVKYTKSSVALRRVLHVSKNVALVVKYKLYHTIKLCVSIQLMSSLHCQSVDNNLSLQSDTNSAQLTWLLNSFVYLCFLHGTGCVLELRTCL